MEGLLIPLSLFAGVFGVFYLHYSTRNKERMALIEKGADASIFFIKKDRRTAPVWKILILNAAVLSMGIGAGVFLAGFLNTNLGVDDDIAYSGSIFFVAGAALFIGFLLSKKLIAEEK